MNDLSLNKILKARELIMNDEGEPEYIWFEGYTYKVKDIRKTYLSIPQPVKIPECVQIANRLIHNWLLTY